MPSALGIVAFILIGTGATGGAAAPTPTDQAPAAHASTARAATDQASTPPTAAATDGTPADPAIGAPARTPADPAIGAPAASPIVATGPIRTPNPPPHRGSEQEAIPEPAPVSELTGYVWPLPRGRLTLRFGPTPWGSRIVNGERFHDGIDLATFCGDRIVAAHDGVVLAAGRRFDQEIGRVGDLTPYFDRLDDKKLWMTLPIVVITDDGNGYRSVYAHFRKIVVNAGQTVRAGQLLGYEGATGRASGCHLHYGLFSPHESDTFAIDPAVVKRMKVPAAVIARVDPLLVLPPRPGMTARPASSPSASPASP